MPERIDPRGLRVITRYVRETCQAMGAADASLWLLDEAEMDLTPVASARTPEHHFSDMRTPVDDSVIGVVARTGMPTVIGPADRHNPIAERVSGIVTAWMVAAPVHERGRICGVLSAIRSDVTVPFTGADLDTMSWRAEIVGYLVQAALERDASA
jgi:signal transduction protein with GAF and PtsI domain